MVKNIERQIRCYVKTDLDQQVSQRHRWTFLILNVPVEIERIRQKLVEQLAMTSNFDEHYNTPIKGSRGLYCRVVSFLSEKGKLEDKSKIYASKNFRFSRDLSVNRDEIGWADYVSRVIGE